LSTQDITQWTFFSAATLVAVFYSYQLLLPILATFIFVDAISNRGLDPRKASKRFLPSLLLVLAAGMLLVIAPRSAQGSSYLSQLLEEGGMEAIPNYVLLPLIVVAGLLYFARTPTDRVALRWTFLASIGYFTVLSVITLRELGYISYYPMRVGYVVVALSIPAVAAVLVTRPFRTDAAWPWFTLSALLALLLAMVPPLVRTPGFKTAYQGSTPTVMRTAATDLFGGGVPVCAPFVLELSSDTALPEDAHVVIVRDGIEQAIEARWVNLLRGSWSSKVWEQEIPFREVNREQRIADGFTLIDIGPDNPRSCDDVPLPPVLPIG